MNVLYTPPTLTDEEVKELQADSKRWIDAHGIMKIPMLFQEMVKENARLTKENNELRGMLEIPPRPKFGLNGKKP